MMRSYKQSGFSLIEMVVVVGIIGLLIAGSAQMIKPYFRMAQANLTEKKMENIALALADFSANYGRLPCPADPGETVMRFYGSPVNSGTNRDQFAVNRGCGANARNYIGIVPFRVLGLNESQVRDNYGNLLTYAVSAAMTEYDTTNLATGDVNGVCRTGVWQENGQNKNIFKARVCCPDRQPDATRKDIVINTARTGGASVFSQAANARTSGNYAPANTVATTAQAVPGSNRLIAFVLISHGENGDGAFLAQQNMNNKRPITANTGAEEGENSDDDLDFVSTIRSRAEGAANGDNYFDDIVVWKTNDQLVSIHGNNSCVRP